MATQYGALVHGRRVDTDVASTVEARALDDGRVVALIAVQGDLATPSLESVKGAFARVTQVIEGVAVKLATSAPPPPYTQPGDALIAASHASLRAGHAFFTTKIQPTADAEFNNSSLDAALESALAPHSALVAVAAARID